jgi:hypothetical protein
MMSMANQPVEQYGNLYTSGQLGPAEMQTQTALANQGAYQGAAGQKDIQSRLDPQAYAQREMRMQAANTRLGRLYGVDPTAFSFRAPGAYQVSGTTNLPSLPDLASAGQAIAGNISTGSVDASGANPQLIAPTSPVNAQTGTVNPSNLSQALAQTPARGYFV